MIITREYIEKLIRIRKPICITNEIIYDKDLSGLDLSSATFIDTTFIKVSLTNTIMKNTTLINTRFKECELTDATLTNSLFENCMCEDSKFIKTKFQFTKLINCIFKNCDCKNTDFQNSKMDTICFSKSDLENTNFMNSTFTELTLDKTITNNVDFTDISINAEKDSNTDCKNNYSTDVKSTKADIYNAVQGILKELGFETFETNDIEAKRKIYEQLINKAKATRKLADNTELLPDLSDEDITNLKMTLNELISFTTARSHDLMHAKGIES